MSHTAASAHYWDIVVHYIQSAFSLFGEPEALARQQWFKRKDQKLVADFLRPLEALIRRLITIAALELTPMTHPQAPEKKFRAPTPTKTEPPIENIDNAATWRVSFRLMARRRPAGRKARQRKAPRTWAGGAWPEVIFTASSAARLEAITRAYKARERLAAKLARRIAQNTALAQAAFARPDNKLESKPVYATLFELIPIAQEAYQAWLHRRLRDTS